MELYSKSFNRMLHLTFLYTASTFEDIDQQSPPILHDWNHSTCDPPHVLMPPPRPWAHHSPPYHHRSPPPFPGSPPSHHHSPPSYDHPSPYSPPSYQQSPPSHHFPPVSHYLPPPNHRLTHRSLDPRHLYHDVQPFMSPPDESHYLLPCPPVPSRAQSPQGYHSQTTSSWLNSLKSHLPYKDDLPVFQFAREKPRHVGGKWFLMPSNNNNNNNFPPMLTPRKHVFPIYSQGGHCRTSPSYHLF